MDPIAGGLDEQQQAAVLAPRGPVCVLAGAGTGKTRTITRRIAHLVGHGHVTPGQVLAVTFTSRAAGEMRTRLRGLGIGGVQARTFHAAALRQLRYFWPQVVGDTPWQLLDRKFAVVSQAANRAGAPTSTESVRDLAGEIEWAKATLVAPEDYPAAVLRHHRDPPGTAEQVAAVYTGYEALKSRGGLLDFDDLLLHTAAALEEHSAVAAEFRERYRCFVVDEYQDVTPLQQRVLDAWLGERDDLTVVGDANQTIYSFTGATPRYLLDFSRRFPDAAVVRLERDYRSTPQVVTLANRVIGAAKGRIAGTKLQLIGQRPSGAQPEFSEHDDESTEAVAVAARIKALLDCGTPAAEIAVLYRINAQSEVHEQALTELGIPYQVRGGDRFFERPEVRQAVLALRKAEQGRRSDDDDADDEAPTDLRVLVQTILEPVGLTAQAPSGGAARDRWESLRALAALVDELVSAEPQASLPRLLTELAGRADSRHPPVVQGVTLSSLHAAKGLEWDAVFLVGLVEGTLPIQHALGDGGAAEQAAVEEERRLLYVGVTRAREVLWLSWALARNPGGRKSRRRSRFVEGLIPADSPAARAATTPRPPTGGRSGRKRARCRVCGSQLIDTLAIKLGRCASCPSDLDDELLEALRVWRRARSQELKVPAYVVFTDATLTAIAEQQPRTDAGLVAIAGIGAAKLERFGADVLALVRGERAAQKSVGPGCGSPA